MAAITFQNRMSSLSPLLLRLGAGAVLALDGLARLAGPSVGDAAAMHASSAGLTLSATWANLVGAAELAVAALLILGFLTRLSVLPVLGSIGYALHRGFAAASDGLAIDQGRFALDAPQTTSVLLALVCVSLLITGSGWLALDRLLLRRKSQPQLPVA